MLVAAALTAAKSAKTPPKQLHVSWTEFPLWEQSVNSESTVQQRVWKSKDIKVKSEEIKL